MLKVKTSLQYYVSQLRTHVSLFYIIRMIQNQN